MKRIKLQGKKLRELRDTIYERAQGLCDYCGFWVGDEFHLHHRQLRSGQGSDIPANCIVTHPHCHERIHHNVAESLEHGFLVSRYGNPAERQMFQHQQSWITL